MPATSSGPGGLAWAARAGGARLLVASAATVYAIGPGSIRALSAANGRPEWSLALPGAKVSRALATGGGVAVATSSRSGGGLAMVAPDGKLAWKLAVTGTVEALAWRGSELVALVRKPTGSFFIETVGTGARASSSSLPKGYEVAPNALLAAGPGGVYISGEAAAKPALIVGNLTGSTPLWMSIPYAPLPNVASWRFSSLFLAGTNVVASLQYRSGSGRKSWVSYVSDGAGMLLNTFAANAAAAGGNVIVASSAGKLAAYVPQGSPIWTAAIPQPSAVVLAGSQVLVASGRRDLSAFSVAHGVPMWHRPLPSPLLAPSPAHAGGRIAPDAGGVAMLVGTSGAHSFIVQVSS